MFRFIIKFIKKIRASEERVRRRWLVILTAVSMTALILIWLTLFTVPQIHPPAGGLPPRPEVKEPAFLPAFNRGLKIVFYQVKGGLAKYRNIDISSRLSRFSTVVSPKKNFILDELEPLPINELP